jgi:multidrug efflux pump subunit AcrA (membrane-fusion protein)
MQGFGSGLQMQYAPKQMAQDFLAKQLANKISGVQAQYAEPMAKTAYDKALFDLASSKQLLPLEMQAKQAQINLTPLEQQLKQAQIQAQLAKAAKDSGVIPGMPEGNIPLSAGTKKEHEAQISSIDEVTKGIKDLATLVKQQGTPYSLELSGGRKAAFKAQVGLITDLLAKAYKLPAFERAFKGAEKNLDIGIGETDEQYLNRIVGLYNKLLRVRGDLVSQMKYGIPSAGSEELKLENIPGAQEPKKTAKDLSDEELKKLKLYRLQQRGA